MEQVKSQFGALYGDLSLPVLLFDEHGSVVRANPALERMTKWSLSGQPPRSVLSFLQLFKDGQTWNMQTIPRNQLTTLTDAQGACIEVSVDYSLLRDERGALCGGLAFVLERGVAVQGLAAARQQLVEDVLDTCRDGVCITDSQGRVVKTNRAFASLLNRSVEEIESRYIYELWPVEGTFACSTGETITLDEAYRTAFLGRIGGELLQGKGDIASLEVYALRGDGTLVPVELSMALRRDAQGVMLGGVGTARDITERRRAARALRQASLLRDRFVTNVTHELRTPLTLILGPLEQALEGEDGVPDAQAREQVCVALRNARQLLTLVNQLLDFSRLDSGAMPVRLESVDLSRFVHNVCASFATLAQSRSVEFVVHCDQAAKRVTLDRIKVGKVLRNLLGNAFKFTSHGGHIAVRAQVSGGSLRLDVQDDGVGIAEHDLEFIFDRFRQAEGNNALGSGVGLAHARELARRLGGEVSVQSAPGQGACFTVQLPLRESSAAEPLPPGTEDADESVAASVDSQQSCEQQVCGDRPLVLIVDDNADVRRFVASIVRPHYDFVCVAGGAPALQELQRRPVDIVLCDVRMPGMDGREVLSRLRARPVWARIPFVFLTARGDLDARVDGLEQGADDYVVKPFNARELLARIRSLLQLRDLREQTEVQGQRIERLTQQLQQRHGFDGLVGDSPAMRRVYCRLESLRGHDSTVLITGETGTGKERVARAIHYRSPRAKGPWVALNCAAVPEALFESELFGHARGAFSGATGRRRGHFEMASGGTLFLDEVGDMPLSLQAKLLRVLESGEFRRLGESTLCAADVRVVAATHHDLSALVHQGRFRQDLYYRLNVITVHLPALRERMEDLPTLVEHFLSQLAEKSGRPVAPLSAAQLRRLARHDYPGNVRELRNAVERAVLLGRVEPPVSIRPSAGRVELGPLLDRDDALQAVQDAAERVVIEHTLRREGNNRAAAARALGLARSSLYRKLQQHGIDME